MVDSHFNGAISAMHTYDYLCEIGHPDGSKGMALGHMARSLGVKREEVIAVGDSPNDVDMIQWAGLGVAMGNASEKVKSLRRPRSQARNRTRPRHPPRRPPLESRFAPLPAPQPTTQ